MEHALQAAYHAEQSSAGDALVVAALLHDIGHLLHKLPEDAADQGIDTRHEQIGHAWLKRYCDEEVTEPIRLHVPAKRYLCADRRRVSGAAFAGVDPKLAAARRVFLAGRN